jgi:hypothetical protein
VSYEIALGAYGVKFALRVVSPSGRVICTSTDQTIIPLIYAWKSAITVSDSINYGAGTVLVRGPLGGNTMACILNVALDTGQRWFLTSGAASAYVSTITASTDVGYVSQTPVLSSDSLSFSLGGFSAIVAAITVDQTVTITWKKQDATAGSQTVITIPVANIKQIPTSLSTNVASAVATNDTVTTASVTQTGGNGFFLSELSSGTGTSLGAASLVGLATLTVGARTDSAAWALTTIKTNASATGTVDATAKLTYKHEYSGTLQWTYDYALVKIVPKEQVYFMGTPTVVLAGSRTEFEANSPVGVVVTVTQSADSYIQTIAITNATIPVLTGSSISSPGYGQGVTGTAATASFNYTSPPAEGTIVFSVDVTTPRGTVVKLSTPARNYLRMPTGLSLLSLFSLNGFPYYSTELSGTMTGVLGGTLGTRFATGGSVATALGLKYDGNTVDSLGDFVVAAGRFAIPARATADTQIFLATMTGTLRTQSYRIADVSMYKFPTAGTTTYTNSAGDPATHLVMGTVYKAVTPFTGGSSSGRLPAANVTPTVDNCTGGTVSGTRVTEQATSVTVTFTPSSQASAPQCTSLVLTLDNTAARTYTSPWTATMYTVPSHSAGTMTSAASIVAGTASTVTVEYTGSLGSLATISNVFVRIGGAGGSTFAATTLTTGSPNSVTSNLVNVASSGTGLEVAIVVKYPSDTGITNTVVPTRGVSISGSTIAVTDPAYELQKSTMDTNVSNEWSANKAGTTNWGITPVQAARFKEYQPDLAGEFALAAKSQATTSFMFRGMGTAWSPGTVSAANIKYLLIVENDAVVSGSATVTSAVRWTATYSGGKTCTVSTSKGSFGADGKYLTNFMLTGGAAPSDFTVYVNGQPVTVNAATSIGPFKETKGLRGSDGALGGMCYADYAMHVVFGAPATIEITGFGVGAADASSKARASATFASYPRFGAFNAYGLSKYADTAAFLAATTQTHYDNFGIPTIETAATLGIRLALAYGMKLDADAAITYAGTRGLTVTDTTVVTPTVVTYPAAQNASSLTSTYWTAGITPMATIATPWPWSGYKNSTLASAGGELPMGYFSDMTTATSVGLPIVATTSAANLPAIKIKWSVTRKKYLLIDPTGKTWIIGGIPKEGFVSNSASFGGTVIDGMSTPTALMGSALAGFRSTTVSWVGCAFHNQTCFQGPSTYGQTFPWAGFYLGSGVAQTGVMGNASSLGVGINKVIVWDIGQANGATWSSTAGLVTNGALNSSTAHNVLMWTPLAGTDPADRETMHVFTLCVDNQASAVTTNATANAWVRLYQNGVKLELANTISAGTIDPTGNVGVKNILFSSGNVAKGTLVGGAPVPNAFASVGAVAKWAFAESDVQAKSGTYSEAEVGVIAQGLCSKWGILPALGTSGGTVVIRVTFNTNYDIKIGRIGFFLTANDALAGTNDMADNKLGFSISGNTWTGGTARRTGSALGATTISGGGDEHDVSVNDYQMPATLPCAGPFVRLALTVPSLTASEASAIRMWMQLRSAAGGKWYTLAFSYNGATKLTGTNACLDPTGTLAFKGVFRLIEISSAPPATDVVAGNWNSANVYNAAMDASPLVTVTGTTAMSVSTRVFNGATYTCFRNTGKITVPAAVSCEILLVGGGGGGAFTAGGGGGAGGVVYITSAKLAAGTYDVTIGAGGAASATDGANGYPGGDTLAFGLRVYGGGGGSHGYGSEPGTIGGSGGGAGYNANSVGSAKKAHTGSLASGVTGTDTSYGNQGGSTPGDAQGLSGNLSCSGGGGAGAVGAGSIAAGQAGAGGAGRSMWSDWCAACGVGERSGASHYIAGGGGGSGNEILTQLKSGAGGLGGGGRGGTGNEATTRLYAGCSLYGVGYSGGGGGGGHRQHVSGFFSVGGSALDGGSEGGSGVIIIKQSAVATTTSPLAPNDASISASLQVWLDANDPANAGTKPNAGDAVISWKDKSGNSHDAANLGTGTAKFCAGDTVGLPSTCSALYFANTSSGAHSGYRITYAGFNPAAYTIFCVFRADRGVTGAGALHDALLQHCYVLCGARDYNLYFGMMNNMYNTVVGPAGSWYGFGQTDPPTQIRGQWVIATMQYLATSKTTTSFLNGVAMTPKGPDAGPSNGGTNWDHLYIANGGNASSAGDYKFQGYIGEILIYNSFLAGATRGGVETWLSNKYGVGMATTP